MSAATSKEAAFQVAESHPQYGCKPIHVPRVSRVTQRYEMPVVYAVMTKGGLEDVTTLINSFSLSAIFASLGFIASTS
jgi:hypothetical protein